MLRMQSPVENDGSQPWYVETVPSDCTSWQSARRWKFRLANGSWPSAETSNRHPELVFAHEDGIKGDPASSDYRHGDVHIQALDRVSLEGRTEVPRGPEGLVLRRGTAAGNAHAILTGGAKLYTPGDVDGSQLLVVTDTVTLTHRQHPSFDLQPGHYRVSAARQGTDGSWADVQD
jgi:hypothetical protein